MNRTDEFFSHVREAESAHLTGDIIATAKPHIASRNNPFNLKAVDLLTRLTKYERVVSDIYEEFTSVHRFLPFSTSVRGNGLKGPLSLSERASLHQELALAIAAIGGELTEMRRAEAMAIAVANMSSSSSSSSVTYVVTAPVNSAVVAHRGEILVYLTERLDSLAQLVQDMQRRADRLSATASPFLLFSKRSSYIRSSSIISTALPSSASTSSANAPGAVRVTAPFSKSSTSYSSGPPLDSLASSVSVTPAATVEFSERYEAEIASRSRLEEYKTLASRHRAALLSEAKDLTGQFKEDLQAARRVEIAVQQVGGLLGELSRVLGSQAGLAEEVLLAAEQAGRQVSGADEELRLTIQRSKSNGRNMTLLAVGLAVLLLLLDWLTP